MKKTIVASILGVVICATANTSYGQGGLIFVNYSFGMDNYSAPVSFGGWYYGPLPLQVVGSDFTAQLLYSATGTPGTFTPVPGAISQFYGTGLGDVANEGGLFQAIGATVPGYTSGNAFFEVAVYNTATVDGFAAGSLFGVSNVAEVSALATATNLQPEYDLFPDNPNIITPLQTIAIVLIPEPSTLALVGLTAILLTYSRRKN